MLGVGLGGAEPCEEVLREWMGAELDRHSAILPPRSERGGWRAKATKGVPPMRIPSKLGMAGTAFVAAGSPAPPFQSAVHQNARESVTTLT